jgi:SAM-dependent methyltransferase
MNLHVEGPCVEEEPIWLDFPELREIIETLGHIPGGRVLDIATGDGDYINLLMETLDDYDSFIGIDINVEDLETGRERFEGKPVELIEMDAETLAFEDASFDTVSIAHSLHHLVRVDAVLAEMRRVLKPGGWFIIQEMFCDGDQTKAQMNDIKKHHWEEGIDLLLGTYNRETFKRGEIEAMARRLDLHGVIALDSVYPVNCPFCDTWAQCLDPMEPTGIAETLEDIDETLEKMNDVHDETVRSRLTDEGETLKERVKENGIYPASTLFVIGRK